MPDDNSIVYDFIFHDIARTEEPQHMTNNNDKQDILDTEGGKTNPDLKMMLQMWSGMTKTREYVVT